MQVCLKLDMIWTKYEVMMALNTFRKYVIPYADDTIVLAGSFSQLQKALDASSVLWKQEINSEYSYCKTK